MCYREGTELIISGNGSGYIKANPYSGHMFREFKGMTEINNLSLLDTSDTTSISFMFYECRSLKNVDISSLNNEKVTDISGLFYMCSALETINGLDTLYTSGVTNMYGMFAYCSSLTSLDVARFDTSKVTNMMYMFLGCKEVPVLDVSRWNTRSLENMQEMFCDCQSITLLDLSGWNTSRHRLVGNSNDPQRVAKQRTDNSEGGRKDPFLRCQTDRRSAYYFRLADHKSRDPSFSRNS